VTQTQAELGKTRDRALLNAAGATLLARGVSAISLVATLAIAAHSLSKPELGVVAVLTTLSAFLSFGDFGLGTLLMTRLPEAHARGDAAAKREIVGVTFNTLCVIGGTIAVLGVATSAVVPWQTLLGAHKLSNSSVREAVICFFVFGGLGIPVTVGGRVLAAMLRSGSAQLWLALSSLISLAATVVCAKENLPIWAYVGAIAGAPAVVALVQTGWVFIRQFPDLRPKGFGVHPKVAWTFMKASSLFAIMSLSAVISYSIDSLVVSSILGAAAAAVFALAARMFSLVGVTIGLAGQQLWSALTDAITRGDHAWARSRFWRTLLISSGINVFACAVLVVFGRELSRIWVGHSLVPSRSLLIVLAVYTVYSTTTLQASYLLTAVEKVKTIALIGIGGAAFNVGASIVLTHLYGISGPILGSIAALVVVLTIPLIVLCRQQLNVLSRDPADAVPAVGAVAVPGGALPVVAPAVVAAAENPVPIPIPVVSPVVRAAPAVQSGRHVRGRRPRPRGPSRPSRYR
jgi:O-antigen/teichoic acid export membrane protein